MPYDPYSGGFGGSDPYGFGSIFSSLGGLLNGFGSLFPQMQQQQFQQNPFLSSAYGQANSMYQPTTYPDYSSMFSMPSFNSSAPTNFSVAGSSQQDPSGQLAALMNSLYGQAGQGISSGQSNPLSNDVISNIPNVQEIYRPPAGSGTTNFNYNPSNSFTPTNTFNPTYDPSNTFNPTFTPSNTNTNTANGGTGGSGGTSASNPYSPTNQADRGVLLPGYTGGTSLGPQIGDPTAGLPGGGAGGTPTGGGTFGGGGGFTDPGLTYNPGMPYSQPSFGGSSGFNPLSPFGSSGGLNSIGGFNPLGNPLFGGGGAFGQPSFGPPTTGPGNFNGSVSFNPSVGNSVSGPFLSGQPSFGGMTDPSAGQMWQTLPYSFQPPQGGPLSSMLGSMGAPSGGGYIAPPQMSIGGSVPYGMPTYGGGIPYGQPTTQGVPSGYQQPTYQQPYQPQGGPLSSMLSSLGGYSQPPPQVAYGDPWGQYGQPTYGGQAQQGQFGQPNYGVPPQPQWDGLPPPNPPDYIGQAQQPGPQGGAGTPYAFRQQPPANYQPPQQQPPQRGLQGFDPSQPLPPMQTGSNGQPIAWGRVQTKPTGQPAPQAPQQQPQQSGYQQYVQQGGDSNLSEADWNQANPGQQPAAEPTPQAPQQPSGGYRNGKGPMYPLGTHQPAQQPPQQPQQPPAGPPSRRGYGSVNGAPVRQPDQSTPNQQGGPQRNSGYAPQNDTPWAWQTDGTSANMVPNPGPPPQPTTPQNTQGMTNYAGNSWRPPSQPGQSGYGSSLGSNVTQPQNLQAQPPAKPPATSNPLGFRPPKLGQMNRPPQTPQTGTQPNNGYIGMTSSMPSPVSGSSQGFQGSQGGMYSPTGAPGSFHPWSGSAPPGFSVQNVPGNLYGSMGIGQQALPGTITHSQAGKQYAPLAPGSGQPVNRRAGLAGMMPRPQ